MDQLNELIHQHSGAKTETEERRIVDEIIRLVTPRLWAYLNRACHQDSVVDDLLQETLLKIYKKLRQFRGNSDLEAISWCLSIARNTLRSHFRKKKIEEHLDPFDAETLWKVIEVSAKKEPFSEGEWQDLEDALTLLGKAKPPCRGYLWSHHIRGMDYKEIAKAYGLNYDAARMQLQRCLKLAIELTAKHL